ncbi:hypothetical protein ACFYUD_32395 [Nocardia tengchongensis]|uniref:hypothetical protein n=1 Tax=Nocardia tengchongensis TaxID=2055889 RepID=UPI0036BB5498
MSVVALGAGGGIGAMSGTPALGVIVCVAVVVAGVTVENRVLRRPHQTDPGAAPRFTPTPVEQRPWCWVEVRTFDPRNSMMRDDIDGISVTASAPMSFATPAEARADLLEWLDLMADVFGDLGDQVRRAVPDPDGQILLVVPPRGWWLYRVPPERAGQYDSVARDFIRAEHGRRLRSLVP